MVRNYPEAMQEAEPLWRSRLRWRWRGALQWPAFVTLTVVDALVLGVLPIAGDGGTHLVPALLLAMFFNLVAVALAAPLLATLLRRRRRDLPRVIAEDHAGTAMLLVVSGLLVAGGVLHRPEKDAAEHAMAAQQAAARLFAHTRAPAQYRARIAESNTLKLEENLYRTCVPGNDPKRWFCMFVTTDESPPGITVDQNRESNTSFNQPTGLR
jgi:hypothetical protein